MEKKFIGREDPLKTVVGYLREPFGAKNLHIFSISGPGGIGKTHLIQHALASVDLNEDNYLFLRIDGASSQKSFSDIVCVDLVSSSHVMQIQNRLSFRNMKKCKSQFEKIEIIKKEQLSKAIDENRDLRQTVKKVLPAVKTTVGLAEKAFGIYSAFKCGSPVRFNPVDIKKKRDGSLNKNSKKQIEKNIEVAKEELELREREKEIFERVKKLQEDGERSEHTSIADHIDEEKVDCLFDTIEEIESYREKNWLIGGSGLRNRLREQPSETVAGMLFDDIECILRNISKDGKRKSVKNLFIFIDDYESLAEKIESFLLNDFLRHIKEGAFNTFVAIVGRDPLNSSPGWEQNYGGSYLGNVHLEPFTDYEAKEFIQKSGIDSEETISRIIEETSGYPFLLASEVEDTLNGGRSALGLKKFFDRTTRWMSGCQKEWMKPICFLSEVNLETIEHMLPDEHPEPILEWFKCEASLRDHRSKKWRVMPLISTKIKEYIHLDSPRSFQILKEKALEAGEFYSLEKGTS